MINHFTGTFHRPNWKAPAVVVVSLALAMLACTSLFGGADALEYDFGDAPDPPYPTRYDSDNPRGPALAAKNAEGGNLSRVILGDCVTVEAEPEAQDRCDDSEPAINQTGGTFRAIISRTDAEASGDFWINVAVDATGDGRWDPENEWLVRNCPVPADGPPQETISCDLEPLSALAVQPESWMRVMVSDLAAPDDGWDGSVFFDAGDVRGEVEDYSVADVAPTPPPAPTVEPTPTPPGAFYPDDPNDADLVDGDGNPIEPAPEGHPSELVSVQMMWVTEDGREYLDVWVTRTKTTKSFSSAVLVILFSESGEPLLGLSWEDHANEVTTQIYDIASDQELPDDAVSILPDSEGPQTHFRIPKELLEGVSNLIVQSFDMPIENTNRGFDETDPLQVPDA